MHFNFITESKKILIISPSFFPSVYGGISVALYHLVFELSKHFSCSIITTNFKIQKSEKILLNKWFYKENYRIVYTNFKYSLYFFQIVIFFLKSVKKNDIIYLNSFFFAPNLILVFLAHLYNKRVIWSTHGELSEPALKIGYYKKKCFLFFYNLFFFKNITYLATSYIEENQIRMRLKSNNIVVIPHFFTLTNLNNIKKKNQFIFLGRLSPIKKIENLIISFSNLLNLNGYFNDYKLLIVGAYNSKDVKYYNLLMYLVKSKNLENHIIFLPEVKIESIQDTIIKITNLSDNQYSIMSNNSKLLAKQFSVENKLQNWFTLLNKE